MFDPDKHINPKYFPRGPDLNDFLGPADQTGRGVHRMERNTSHLPFAGYVAGNSRVNIGSDAEFPHKRRLLKSISRRVGRFFHMAHKS